MYEPAVTKMMGSSTNDTAGTPLRDKTDMVGLRKFAMRQPFHQTIFWILWYFMLLFLTCFPPAKKLPCFLSRADGKYLPRYLGRLGLEFGQMHMLNKVNVLIAKEQWGSLICTYVPRVRLYSYMLSYPLQICT